MMIKPLATTKKNLEITNTSIFTISFFSFIPEVTQIYPKQNTQIVLGNFIFLLNTTFDQLQTLHFQSK